VESQAKTRCAECGSSKVVRDVTVFDQGDGSDGELHVVVCGDPDALVFKDRYYGVVGADVCGDCGHMELRVRNPQELYRHYLDSRNQ
jgi:hypothetical protein